MKMGPELKNMDKMKQMKAKVVEEITGCRVEKAGGGKSRYVHQRTNRRIRPADYEEMYMTMQDEFTSIRSKAWGSYFAHLRQEQQQKTENRPQDPCSATKRLFGASPRPLNRRQDNMDLTAEDDLPEESEESPLVQVETVELHQVSASNEEDVVKDNDGSSYHDMFPEKKATDEKKLLPLPSRDETCSDPDIARAEKKLWRSIDEALEVYSGEVLAIRAAKRAKSQP